jgi:proteasome lid subunit RPN8/RPN11
MRLTVTQRDELVARARAAMPHEACGLLAGAEGVVRAVMPLTNVEHNPVGCGWRADSREQFLAFRRIDEQGWELLAIYHSHPRTPAYPSDRDAEHALFPDARYLIVSLADPAAPVVSAFRIDAGQVTEEPIAVGAHDPVDVPPAEVS